MQANKQILSLVSIYWSVMITGLSTIRLLLGTIVAFMASAYPKRQAAMETLGGIQLLGGLGLIGYALESDGPVRRQAIVLSAVESYPLNNRGSRPCGAADMALSVIFLDVADLNFIKTAPKPAICCPYPRSQILQTEPTKTRLGRRLAYST
jgi:hypothetical protein